MEEIIGYKVFDSEWKCRGFQFEVGKRFKQEGTPILCEHAFHFCRIAAKCFDYYSFDPKNKVALIKAHGVVVGDKEDKEGCNDIEIIEEVSWEKLLTIVNTGVGNSGNRNSGVGNSGNRNSGDWNSGDWNSGNWNSGYMNSKTPDTILVFNKPLSIKTWDSCAKPSFIYFYLTKWIDWDNMSDDEKKEHPSSFVTEGYLKTYEYKEAFMDSYSKASKEDIELLKNLPNFDADVFYEISGIRVE